MRASVSPPVRASVSAVAAREALNLPLDKKIILLGAQSLKDHYKGAVIFSQAPQLVHEPDVHVVVFGK